MNKNKDIELKQKNGKKANSVRKMNKAKRLSQALKNNLRRRKQMSLADI